MIYHILMLYVLPALFYLNGIGQVKKNWGWINKLGEVEHEF